jgi:uncharacterized membrane protein YuzA (DUF378 family)
MKPIGVVAAVLAVVGALNWGLAAVVSRSAGRVAALSPSSA